MSSATDDGGPAFPHLHHTCQRINESEMYEGLTARDYFAAAAMTALIAKIPLHDRLGKIGVHAPEIEDIHRVRLDVAESAYDYADAMLAARGAS